MPKLTEPNERFIEALVMRAMPRLKDTWREHFAAFAYMHGHYPSLDEALNCF